MSTLDSELFSFDVRLGIYMSVQAACLSAAAVVILLSYAFIRWWKRGGRKSSDSDASGSSLFLNLMLADLIQAIGAMPSIRWMRNGSVTEGELCTAQAVIKQIGINGVALSSLFIAFHTFGVLLNLRWRTPKHASKLSVLFIWVFTALVVGIPYAVNRNEPYYGDTGYWCWIVEEQSVARLMSEYLWVWASAFIMAILYGIMFLVMRGFLLVNHNGKVSFANTSRVKPDLAFADNEDEREARAMANLLLFYPAVYIICIFPNTLARWLTFSGKDVPATFSLFASSIFAFSGLFNVILYFCTRKEYAVGPSAVPTITTALPPDSAHHHSYSASDKFEPVGGHYSDIELNARYGQREAQDQGRYGGNGSLGTGVLHQSPARKPVPLGYGEEHIASHGRNTSSAGDRKPSMDPYKLDDDDDYGRLPG